MTDFNNKTDSQRINCELTKYIEKIKKKEGCSFPHASKILVRILDEAGGLKDYP